MTYEEATYYRIMFQAGFTDLLDEWLEKELAEQEKLSDLVLELSLCGSDKNKIISVLHNYCVDNLIDGNAVFNLVWNELHNIYVNNLLTQEELIKSMRMIYEVVDDVDCYWYNPGVIDCYWQTLYLIFLYQEEAEEGLITKEAFEKVYHNFLLNKVPAVDNNPFEIKDNEVKIKMRNKNKGIKIIAIILATILVLGIGGFSFLFLNGLSGLHIRTKAQDGQIKVACVGDSITYGHGVTPWHKNNYPAVLQNLLGDDYNVQNFGESGTTVQKDGDQPYWETKVYTESHEYNADILIFMLGSNDSKPENWTDAETFKKDYLALLDTYITDDNSPKIYLGIPAKAFYEDENQTSELTSYDIQGDIVEEIGEIIKEIAAERGYKYVDIYELTSQHPEWFAKDNIHPNSDGAKAIAEEFYKFVTDIEFTDLKYEEFSFFVGKRLDIDSQIKLIAGSLNDCINNLENYLDCYGIAVTDLNYDNKLELIVATNGGTGNRTICYIYEIAYVYFENYDYTSLYDCDINFVGNRYQESSNADILSYDELVHYYTGEQHNYVLEDTGQCGWANQYSEKIAVSLAGKTYNELLLASSVSEYTLLSDEPNVKIFDKNGNTITENEYNQIEDIFFKSYNKDIVKIGWIKLLTRDNYPNGFLKYTNNELIELLNNSYNTFIGN